MRLLPRPVLALGLAACTGAPDDASSPSTAAVVCHDDLAPGEVEVFASGFTVDGVTGTEGLAFSPDGRMFVGGSGITGGGYVAEVSADGSWSVLTELPSSVGLVWFDGRLVVATTDVGDDSGGLVAVDVDTGHTEVIARGIPGANFPAPTPWGTLLVSAPGGSTLWEVDDGAVSVWAEGLPSPNGIAFAPDAATAYVANTYGSPNTVTAVQVVDGQAAAQSVHATFPDGSTQDGVAIDSQGTLYVVNNLPGTVVSVTADGEVATVAEGVAFGASLAFGEGGFDPCSLYVSSLFSADVFRVAVGAR